jgi:hypothetical protein
MAEEPKAKPTPAFEHWAYDTRDGRVYRFKRLSGYVLLQTLPMMRLIRIIPDDFDKYFEGMPAPTEPFLSIVRR